MGKEMTVTAWVFAAMFLLSLFAWGGMKQSGYNDGYRAGYIDGSAEGNEELRKELEDKGFWNGVCYYAEALKESDTLFYMLSDFYSAGVEGGLDEDAFVDYEAAYDFSPIDDMRLRVWSRWEDEAR